MNDETKPTGLWSLMSDHQGRRMIGVHFKSTFKLQSDGSCNYDTPQAPLLIRPIIDLEGNEVFSESDVYPEKFGVDFVLMASAYGRGRGSMEASIRLAGRHVRLAVFGERRCSYRGPGTLTVGQPEPFDTMPLLYDRAYGGIDPTVPDQRPVENILDLLEHHPGMYPRNPIGKGYAVFENAERLDGLELPNIENPAALLRPERIIVPGPDAWWRQPFPWGCEWFDKSWYPRCAYIGVMPETLPIDDREMYEVVHRMLESPQRERYPDSPDTFDYRIFNAGSPGLLFPSLRGDEAVELVGMSDAGRDVVRLPGRPPEMVVRTGGRPHALVPHVHRILVSLEEGGVSIVWHASMPAPDDLLARLPGPEDDLESLARAEVFVNRERVRMLQ